MAFDLDVVNQQDIELVHRVVPVRFARAVSGRTNKRAPDIDDRGFVAPSRFCSARGPVVGVMKRKTIRIKLIRDRLEPDAKLFVSSEDDSIAAVEFPPTGEAISAVDVPAADPEPERKGDCIYIHGASTSRSSQETLLKVHFGSQTGPVLAEIAIRVLPILVVNVQAHSVAINTGTQAITNMASIRGLFSRVNHIYAQAGIYFRLRPNLMNEVLTGFARNNSVTLSNVGDSRNAELQTVLNSNSRKDHLNVYFIRNYVDIAPTTPEVNHVLGIAFSSTVAAGNPPSGAFPGTQAGVTARLDPDVRMMGDTIAHEIGHSLTLNHCRLSGHNSEPEDIWSYRNLMYYNTKLDGKSGIDSIGYGRLANGDRTNGTLITTKRYSGIRESDQANRLRRACLGGRYKPVRLP
ncbi:MAG: hypothetical protein ACJAS1_005488 [Oleiphilaceae bacterium]|jgi:hypothetical protein